MYDICIGIELFKNKNKHQMVNALSGIETRSKKAYQNFLLTLAILAIVRKYM